MAGKFSHSRTWTQERGHEKWESSPTEPPPSRWMSWGRWPLMANVVPLKACPSRLVCCTFLLLLSAPAPCWDCPGTTLGACIHGMITRVRGWGGTDSLREEVIVMDSPGLGHQAPWFHVLTHCHPLEWVLPGVFLLSWIIGHQISCSISPVTGLPPTPLAPRQDALGTIILCTTSKGPSHGTSVPVFPGKTPWSRA